MLTAHAFTRGVGCSVLVLVAYWYDAFKYMYHVVQTETEIDEKRGEKKRNCETCHCLCPVKKIACRKDGSLPVPREIQNDEISPLLLKLGWH